MTNNKIQLVRAASGARSDRSPATKTPPPRIHLAPNFSAKLPAKDRTGVDISLSSGYHLLFCNRKSNLEVNNEVCRWTFLHLTDNIPIEESAEKKSLFRRIPIEFVFLCQNK